MAYSDLSDLPLLFIAVGLGLLLTSLILNWRARRHLRRIKNLLALANRDIEPLALPVAAWPLLADSRWQHMDWQGNWFGQPVSGTCGAPTHRPPAHGHPLKFTIRGGADAQLELTLTHATPGSEAHILAEQLARVFVLLLESRIRAQTEALSAALAARASLSLYLQHDMRNLAQWVTWVSADFTDGTNPEALNAAARRLHHNAPLAQERAERLIAALGQQPPQEWPVAIALRPAIEQAAQLAGLTVQIEGDAHVWIARSLLTRALDNLFSNMATFWRQTAAAPPHLQIQPDQTRHAHPLCEVRLCCHWPEDAMRIPAEKRFEPFTSGRPGGLGLGLYQARKSLREGGGDLMALPDPEEGKTISFILKLPEPQAPPSPQPHPAPKQTG